MQIRKYGRLLSIIALGFAATATLLGQAPVGLILPYSSESPHPYPVGGPERSIVWQETVISPGAKFLRVHFVGLSLAPGDYLTLSNADGLQSSTYTGRGPHENGDLFAVAVDGDKAVIAIHGGPVADYGYRIDRVGHGDVALGDINLNQWEGSAPNPDECPDGDPRENVACRFNDPVFVAGERPVALLIFDRSTDPPLNNGDIGVMAKCTGWLINSIAPNMLITANHCISTDYQVSTLQATFNVQRHDCVGGPMEPRYESLGVALIRGSPPGILDYTLLTVAHGINAQWPLDPDSTWGVVTPTTEPLEAGDQGLRIWIPQHPFRAYLPFDNAVKVVGWFEIPTNDLRCRIRSASGTTLGYHCPTSGGSSGSPVEDSTTGHAVALHTQGNKGGLPLGCPTWFNWGSAFGGAHGICADAGGFINCAEN